MGHLEVDMIMVGAINEATLMQQSNLGSEHILLSILRNEGYAVTKLLNKCGMSYDEVRNDLLSIRGFLPDIVTQLTFSDVVWKLLNSCDSATSLIQAMMVDSESMASMLLKRYCITIEKLLH